MTAHRGVASIARRSFAAHQTITPTLRMTPYENRTTINEQRRTKDRTSIPASCGPSPRRCTLAVSREDKAGGPDTSWAVLASTLKNPPPWLQERLPVMFDDVLIESAGRDKGKGTWATALVSSVIHVVLIGAVVAAGVYAK